LFDFCSSWEAVRARLHFRRANLEFTRSQVKASRAEGTRCVRGADRDPPMATAVKERRLRDFKGLTRGGRPLSRWKSPVDE
jgi:hypothetical protein